MNNLPFPALIRLSDEPLPVFPPTPRHQRGCRVCGQSRELMPHQAALVGKAAQIGRTMLEETLCLKHAMKLTIARLPDPILDADPVAA